jgi:hypothetical protein
LAAVRRADELIVIGDGWTTVEEAHGSGKKISVEGERAWSTPAPNHPELGSDDVLGVAI